MTGINAFSAEQGNEFLQRLNQRIFITAVKIGSAVTLCKESVSRKNSVVIQEEAYRASRMTRRQSDRKIKISESEDLAIFKRNGRCLTKNPLTEEDCRSVFDAIP